MQSESEPQKYVLWLTAFFATFSFVSVLPGLPSYLDDRGLFYGFATAAFPAATAVFSFVVPRAQRTQSSRSILIFCFVVAGLCSVCFGLIRNKWAILIMRFIMGATTSCVVVVRDDLNKLCGKDKNKRIKVMSLFTFSMGMGYAVGALIGSGLQKLSPSVSVYDHFALDGNTYSGFVLCGLEALLIVLTLVFVPHTPPAFAPQTMAGIQVAPNADGSSSSTPSRLLPPTSDGSLAPMNPTPASPPPPQDIFTMQHIMVYLSTCFVTISFVAYVTLAVPYIAELEDLSESTAGLIEAAIGGAYGIAAICNPSLIHHMRSSAATLTLGGLTAAGANAMMLHDPALPRVIIGCCFIGLAYSIINSVGMYHLGDLSKGDRFAQLRSFAVVSSLASVGRVLAPVMAGIMLYFHKEQAVYITSLLFGLLSSSYCLFVWIRSGCMRTDHPETQSSAPPPPSGEYQRLT